MLRRRIGASTLLCIAACATWPTGLREPSRDVVVEGEGLLRTYDNGLTLFIAPDPHTPLLQLDMRQRVGSRDDPQGKGSLAHLVEHMMFELADPTTSATIAAELSTHALDFQAQTSDDDTHYRETGTVEDLEMFLRHATLRLSADCRTLAGATLERQREIVRNELAWRRSLVMPLLRHDAVAHVFPEEHPYHRAPLPEDSELDAITIEDVCTFVDRYYTASQSTIVITGDVDPVEVAALAETTIARLPNIVVDPRDAVPAIALGGRTVEVAADVQRPVALVLFELPPRFTREHVAARTASHMLLVFGIAAQLAAKVRPDRMPTFARAELGGKATTLVGLSIEAGTDEELELATRRTLDAIVEGFAYTGGGTDFKASYDVARQLRRLDVIDRIFHLDRRGAAYADYLEQEGEPSFVGGELATIDGLTGNDMQHIGRTTFARNRAVVVEVVPRARPRSSPLARARFDTATVADEISSSAATVEDDPHRPIDVPLIAPDRRNIRALWLDNGMRVVLARSTSLPIVEMQLVVDAGFDTDDDGPALAALAAFAYGPPKDALAQDLLRPSQLVGASVERVVGRRTTTFTTRGLSIYIDHLVAALAEHVVEGELDREAYDAWHDLEAAAARDPSTADARHRSRAVLEALYGKGHPWARLDMDTTEAIYPDLVRGFRRRHYAAPAATLVVSGGIDLDLATEHVRAHFGAGKRKAAASSWQREPYADEADIPRPQRGKAWLFTEIDDRNVQTEVSYIFALDDVLGSNHASLTVAVEMIDTEAARVREVLGATYGVDAVVRRDHPRVEVHGAIDSSRAAEGLASLHDALVAAARAPDFDRRFAAARRRVVQRVLAERGDPRLHADQFAEAARHGVAFDTFDNLPLRVAATSPTSVRAIFDTVLKPTSGVMLVRGPERGVSAALAQRGARRHVALPRPDRHDAR